MKFTSSKILQGILVTLLPILVSSCAVSSKVQNKVTYVSEDFSTSMLYKEGLCLLPITAGQGIEGYRRPFGQAMNKIADSIIANFMPWQETLNKINKAKFVKEYNEAIQSYQITGIISRSFLKKLYQVTGKNFFLFIRLEPPMSEKRVGYNVLSGISTYETKSISAHGILWSTQKGDVVWEGVATNKLDLGPYNYSEESMMDRSKKVAEALMSKLLNKNILTKKRKRRIRQDAIYQ